MRRWLGVLLCVGAAGCDAAPSSEGAEVDFFVSSVGSGRGGDLGGLEGADAHCQSLADAAGLAPRTWRAFLSASDVDARDRIGDGPWRNAAGDVVAQSVEQLLSDGIQSELMLDELGEPAARSAPPGREHDILTGSDPQGQWVENRSCADWTSNAPEDRVAVGHHDWSLLPDDEWVQHWANVHGAPCDAEGMARQLGTARTYCFGF